MEFVAATVRPVSPLTKTNFYTFDHRVYFYFRYKNVDIVTAGDQTYGSAGNTLKNTAVVSGTVNHGDKHVQFTSEPSDSVRLKPAEYHLSLSKGCSGTSVASGKVYAVGSTISCSIGSSWSGSAPYGTLYKNLMVVDLLPAGLDIPTTSSATARGGSINGDTSKNSETVPMEVVQNYKNTGKTALIWHFGDVTVGGNMTPGLSISYSAKINSDAVPNYAVQPAKSITDTDNNINYAFMTDDSLFNNPAATNSSTSYGSTIQDDTHDLFGLGTDHKMLQTDDVINVLAPDAINAVKSIRSNEPADGSSTPNYSAGWGKAIGTHFSGDGNSGNAATNGLFQYKLSVQDYTEVSINSAAIYEPLPYAGDARGAKDPQKSEFAPVLLSAPTIDVNGTDASADYTVYYRTDANPSTKADDIAAEVASDKWTTSVDDYTKVTAIKVVAKPGVKLPAHATLNVVLNMKAPAADAALRGDLAWNNFYVSYNDSGLWGESNNVSDSLPGFLKFDKRSSAAGCSAKGSDADCDAATLLGGSEWSLETPAGKSIAFSDCESAPCPADSLDQDPAAGKFDLDLPAGADPDYGYGTYKLIETKAPDGYQLLAQPVSFDVSADNPNVSLTGLDSIVDSQPFGLPDTGGSHTALFISIGAAIGAFALAGVAEAVSARRRHGAHVR